MEKVSEQIREQITNAKKFNITKVTFEKEVKKQKNQTTPGTDGVQKFSQKRLKLTRKALKKAFERVKDNKNLIPVGWPS